MPKANHMGSRASDLEQTFEQMWTQVRQPNLYSGRPRNELSEESVAVARSALALATDVNEPRFLREAWCMMAYALNANEEYIESIVYCRQAIKALEDAGESQRAARMRLGFIIALSLTGQSQEALIVAREAGTLFRQQQDRASLAKLAT